MERAAGFGGVLFDTFFFLSFLFVLALFDDLLVFLGCFFGGF